MPGPFFSADDWTDIAVAKHEVMWIGRQPAAMAPEAQPAEAPAFAEAVTAACADCGCVVEEYIAAAGIHGSWLVFFEHEGSRRRLVWNGKEGTLVLEQATAGIDWDLLATTGVPARDLEHFLPAIRSLLTRPA